ncbi:MAG: SDR family oxidoreductase [Wenzhouxiangella sp.]
MPIDNLLVFGATGTQGHPVVDAALEAGLRVRAASRDPDAAADKLSSKAEIVYADLLDKDSIDEAVAGMSALFFHLPVMPDTPEADQMISHVISAAQAHAVERLVVTTGGYCGPAMPDRPFVAGLRRMADRFQASGIDCVVLRPTLYLANLVWPHLIRQIRETGRLTYPPLSRKRRMNWTATEDQGRIAVACLNAEVAGEILDIASPGVVDSAALCRLLATAYQREVHFDPQSLDDFADGMSHLSGSADVGRQMAQFYADLDALPLEAPVVDTEALAQRLGIELTPIERWMDERLATLLNLYG